MCHSRGNGLIGARGLTGWGLVPPKPFGPWGLAGFGGGGMLILTPLIGRALLWLVGVGRRAVHGMGWGPILDLTSHIWHFSVCRSLSRWIFGLQFWMSGRGARY